MMVAVTRRTKTTKAGTDYDVAIDNPLTDFSYDQLEEYASYFAEQIFGDPTEEQSKLFRKAARIARDGWKGDWLSPKERRVFEQEKDKTFWNQPKPLKVTVLTLCFSAIIQGWLQTGSNAANQKWPQQFGLTTGSGDGTGNPENLTATLASTSAKWQYAAVNAITYLVAGLFGCWLSDPLHAKYLGRRGAIFVSAVVCLAAVIGAACTRTWQELLACRLLIGIGMGAKGESKALHGCSSVTNALRTASVTPIFGAEVSPSHLRGALVMNWQLFDAFGIFLGTTANLIVKDVGPTSWRWQFASAALPLICLLVLVFTIPESPRWLLKKGRIEKAYQSMRLLRESDLQAATQVLYANAQLQQEVQFLPGAEVHTEGLARRNTRDELPPDRFQRSVRSSHYWMRLWQLFSDRRTRRATVASAVVMLGQNLCGINLIAFYSSTFFRDAGTADNADNRALYLSWGWGLSNFVFTFPAYWFIDKRGRLWLLLTTYPGMILSMLAAALSFLAPDPTVRNVLNGIFIFSFTFFYAFGQGPVAFAYSSEVFPLSNREAGMSFAVFVNLFSAGLLTLFTPLAGSGPHDQALLLGIFTIFNILSLILIFFLVPETSLAVKAADEDEETLEYISLEELNYIFGVKMSMHIRFQFKKWLPWAQRYARWKLRHVFTNEKIEEVPAAPQLEERWLYSQRKEMEWRAAREQEAGSPDGESMERASSGVVEVEEVDDVCEECGHRRANKRVEREGGGHLTVRKSRKSGGS